MFVVNNDGTMEQRCIQNNYMMPSATSNEKTIKQVIDKWWGPSTRVTKFMSQQSSTDLYRGRYFQAFFDSNVLTKIEIDGPVTNYIEIIKPISQ
jgi:hypothetical protein